MTNEEHIEEILVTAHVKGFAKDVIRDAGKLMEKGIDRFNAFNEAYIERNEIYRREHPKQRASSSDDKKGS